MANNESEIIQEALVACGDDYGGDDYGAGAVYLLLCTEPTTVICDLLAQKLNELGYRVTKPLNNQETGEN